MFGALYFGQMEVSGVEVDEDAVTPTGGGGWSYRGPVNLPQRKKPEWKPPVFKKPNPYRW